ncbi:hypothetical protein TNCV_1162411 [Trichonephila clavipes]|nr:hypothetical protein TNCV_1162411 [Trichonephila clavipes]
MEHHMVVSLEHLVHYHKDGNDTLFRFVTGNESWVLYFTPEMKAASMKSMIRHHLSERSSTPSASHRLGYKNACRYPYSIRHIRLYHFENRWKAAQSFREFNELFDEDTISESRSREYFTCFKPDNSSLEDKPGKKEGHEISTTRHFWQPLKGTKT